MNQTQLQPCHVCTHNVEPPCIASERPQKKMQNTALQHYHCTDATWDCKLTCIASELAAVDCLCNILSLADLSTGSVHQVAAWLEVLQHGCVKQVLCALQQQSHAITLGTSSQPCHVTVST